MMSRLPRFSMLLTPLLLAASLFLLGCPGDSAEKIIRTVELIVAGFYQHPDHPNSTLVANNTGAAVTSLDLRQTGDQLEAVDNNGAIYKGTIGQADATTASFTLRGITSAGQDTTVSGTIRVPEGSTDATMSGTWIEPTLFSTINGVATVPQNTVSTNDTSNGGSSTNGTSTLSITASSTSILVGDTISLTASGNDGTVNWDLFDESLGSLSATTGNSVNYTADITGTQVISGTDDSATQNVTINQN